MHIKHVVMQGFRSFKSQEEIHAFSSKANVIVGRNGAGKSNFFKAIQFVLLDPKFASLSQERRQDMLHEGVGPNAMSAHVEITFDNSDGRLSVDSHEVVLRRIIGLKKDEFFLNRKRVQKDEVVSLLESAGFSKSNPYYIVEQGKISALCTKKDEERLDLLKEVAGTNVYEERRQESLKILSNTTDSMTKVNGNIEELHKRLEELGEQKEELKAYEESDRMRRALEHALYSTELKKAREKISELEQEREATQHSQEGLHSSLLQIQDSLATDEKKLEDLKEEVAKIERRKAKYDQEKQTLLQRKSHSEVFLNDAQQQSVRVLEEQKQLESKLRELDNTINTEQELLHQIRSEFLAKQAELRAVTKETEESTDVINALYAKEGRGKQFSSIEERDKFLTEELDRIRASASARRAQCAALVSECEGDETAIVEQERLLEVQELAIVQHDAKQKELAARIRDSTAARNALHDRKRSIENELEEIIELVRSAMKEVETAKRDVTASAPARVHRGLAFVERYVLEKGLRGCYGPVIENIKLTDDAYTKAVEAAAGLQLFHVIVDDDVIASELIEQLSRQPMGRLTFLPLTRLHNSHVHYPRTDGVAPLLDTCLTYDPTLEAAIRHVFGKKLLAQDLEMAETVSVECDMDVVTINGDVASRNGAVDGGYIDDRRSKIRALNQMTKAQTRLKDLSARQEQLKAQVQDIETQLGGTLRTLHSLESERVGLRSAIEGCVSTITITRQRLEQLRINLEKKKERLAAFEREVTVDDRRMADVQNEMNTPLRASLTTDEKAQIHQLRVRQKELLALSTRIQKELDVVEAAMGTKQALLEHSLKREKTDVISRLSIDRGGTALVQSGVGEDVQQIRQDIEQVDKQLSLVEGLLRETVDVLANTLSESSKLAEVTEQRRQEESELQEQVEEAEKRAEKILNKRKLLVQTRDTNIRALQELGSLPDKEYSRIKHLGEKELVNRIKDTNLRLKRFGHLNKKALEQYRTLSEDREQLIARRDELQKDERAIAELIETLDREKDEATMRTFRQVAMHFKQVFKELVPEGEGSLIIKTRGDDIPTAELDSDDEDGQRESKGEEAQSSVSDFTGVQVSVRFAGTGSQVLMQQLSGGQKALVALALIFAMQRCDPAPFYLFDEPDQALDGNYRAAVASLMKRQAEARDSPTQFIVTTFRAELVSAAHQWYGISHQNKVSHMDPMTKMEALTFVTNLLLEEEAVGPNANAKPRTPAKQRRAGGKAASTRASSMATSALEPLREENENEDEVEDNGNHNGRIEEEDDEGKDRDQDTDQPRHAKKTRSKRARVG